MKLKISDKVICIPPYISTTWDRVTFLQTEEETKSDGSKGLILILHLIDDKKISIANLDPSIIEIIFTAHLKYLELNQSSAPKNKSPFMAGQLFGGVSPEQLIGFPLKFGPGGVEGLEQAFQHNASQSDTPEIPDEILQKIASIAKIVTNGDISQFPKPEPHCNCMHCQVAKAVHGEEQKVLAAEEAISDEELKFRLWDISQNGDKLYIVSNPLDSKEQYSVYLGTPVGCTCGQSHCEHIKAVLTS